MNFKRFSQHLRLGMPAADSHMMFKGSKKSKSSYNSTSTTTHNQDGQYDNLLAGSDAWLNSGGFDKNYGGSEGFDPIAGFTQEQEQGLQGLGKTGRDLQSVYGNAGMKSLQDSLGQYDPSKTGLNDALGAMNERMNFDYNTQVAPQIRQGAQEVGQYGSSRHGIAEGLALDRLSQNQANVGSQMAWQDQQSWNNNRRNTLNNLSGITDGLTSGDKTLYNAGATQQGQNQAEIAGQLEKWAYENNIPANDLAAYKSLISGDMGGTEVSSGQSKNTQSGGGGGLGSALGSIGGGLAGFMFGGGPMGVAPGMSAGGSLGGSIGGLLK